MEVDDIISCHDVVTAESWGSFLQINLFRLLRIAVQVPHKEELGST
jgi:hypothetical protein